MRVGNRIGERKRRSWESGIGPLLVPGEQIECMVRTKGLVPPHDQMIVTSERLIVGQAPILGMPPTIVHQIPVATISDADAKWGRLQIRCTDGSRYSIPLDSADDAPLVLETLTPGSQSPAANLGGYVPAAIPAQRWSPKPSFNADRPPRRGATVPQDCVWATIPYPGPLKNKAKNAIFKVDRVAALDPIARPMKEIISTLGKPNSTSTNPDGTFIHQWQSIHPAKGNSYHVALIFDRYGVCSGVAQQWVG